MAKVNAALFYIGEGAGSYLDLPKSALQDALVLGF